MALKYACLVILGCFYTIAIVFIYLYIFGENIIGKSYQDNNILEPTLRQYFTKGSFQPGEKLLITLEIMKTQEKQVGEQRKAVTIRLVQNVTAEERRQYVIKKLLLNKTYCGQQHWDEYYHLENETNGYETHVYEFPWLVSLINNEFRCNGFLISNRYFITTKECFYRGYETVVDPKVLVGVHDIHKPISCIALPYANDCTTGSKPLRILEGFQINSIVLVKMDKGVYFNNFIRPICLPLEDGERPEINNVVYISGWGRLLENKDYVSIKKRNRQKIISLDDDNCKLEDVDSKHWICTVPVQNSTTACQGDDGSPTMYISQQNWFAAGIAVAGPICVVNRPVFSIAITADVLNKILDAIYNDNFKSQQSTSSRKRKNR